MRYSLGIHNTQQDDWLLCGDEDYDSLPTAVLGAATYIDTNPIPLVVIDHERRDWVAVVAPGDVPGDACVAYNAAYIVGDPLSDYFAALGIETELL